MVVVSLPMVTDSMLVPATESQTWKDDPQRVGTCRTGKMQPPIDLSDEGVKIFVSCDTPTDLPRV